MSTEGYMAASRSTSCWMAQSVYSRGDSLWAHSPTRQGGGIEILCILNLDLIVAATIRCDGRGQGGPVEARAETASIIGTTGPARVRVRVRGSIIGVIGDGGLDDDRAETRRLPADPERLHSAERRGSMVSNSTNNGQQILVSFHAG
ncbi:hypothetical protein HYQ46_001346 [Verticillium longisporum]|nr:hypothetical protein HYQ46_001346 [Verticillium longisporum]